MLSNLVPPDSRETWQLCLDPDKPLVWHNYQLCIREKGPRRGAITWRLSKKARAHYHQRLARLIAGRGAVVKIPYKLTDDTAREQVLKLAQHMRNYPGLSEICADIFQLSKYSTKVWKSTRPKAPYPKWPTMPYLRFREPQTAPLWQLTQHIKQATNQSENQSIATTTNSTA